MQQRRTQRNLARAAAALLTAVTLMATDSGVASAARKIKPGCAEAETFCMYSGEMTTTARGVTQTRARFTRIRRGQSPYEVQNKFTNKYAHLTQEWDLWIPQVVPPGGRNAPRVRVESSIRSVRLTDGNVFFSG